MRCMANNNCSSPTQTATTAPYLVGSVFVLLLLLLLENVPATATLIAAWSLAVGVDAPGLRCFLMLLGAAAARSCCLMLKHVVVVVSHHVCVR